jgi:Ternary complex associated domain 9
MSRARIDGPKVHLSGLRRNSALVERLAKRVFERCSEVTLQPLIDAEEGFSGASILRVDGVVTDRGTKFRYTMLPCVLKVGPPHKIRQELRNFRNHVRLVVENAPQIYEDCYKSQGNLAAIAYTKIGGRWDDVCSFKQQYLDLDLQKLERLLDHLFREVMGPWASNTQPSTKPIWAVYALRRAEIERLRRTARPLKAKGWEGRAKLGPFDPTAYLPALLGSKVSGGPSEVLFSTVHGDLNSANILFNKKEDKLYLIDFSHTGPGHHLRDFAKLEVDIKFLLTKSALQGISDAVRQWQFLDLALDSAGEQGQSTLWSPISYPAAESFVKKDESINRALQAISRIRRLAAGRMRSREEGEAIAYRVALIHYTLKALSFADVDKWRRLLAYRSAGRMSQFRLGRPLEPLHRRTPRREWHKKCDVVLFIWVNGNYEPVADLAINDLRRYWTICGCMFPEGERLAAPNVKSLDLIKNHSLGIITVVVDKNTGTSSRTSCKPEHLLELGLSTALEAFGEYLAAEDKVGRVEIGSKGEFEDERAKSVYHKIYADGTKLRVPTFFQQLIWERPRRTKPEKVRRVQGGEISEGIGISRERLNPWGDARVRATETLADISKRQVLTARGVKPPRSPLEESRYWGKALLKLP